MQAASLGVGVARASMANPASILRRFIAVLPETMVEKLATACLAIPAAVRCLIVFATGRVVLACSADSARSIEF